MAEGEEIDGRGGRRQRGGRPPWHWRSAGSGNPGDGADARSQAARRAIEGDDAWRRGAQEATRRRRGVNPRGHGHQQELRSGLGFGSERHGSTAATGFCLPQALSLSLSPLPETVGTCEGRPLPTYYQPHPSTVHLTVSNIEERRRVQKNATYSSSHTLKKDEFISSS
jgi:hypothetical protein